MGRGEAQWFDVPDPDSDLGRFIAELTELRARYPMVSYYGGCGCGGPSYFSTGSLEEATFVDAQVPPMEGDW